MQNKNLVCAGKNPWPDRCAHHLWPEDSPSGHQRLRATSDRLAELRPRAAVGKDERRSGPQAAFGKNGNGDPNKSHASPRLTGWNVSNQVVQRDRHAEMVCWMALVASTLDKIFVEMRTLSAQEIAEVEEGFSAKNRWALLPCLTREPD